MSLNLHVAHLGEASRSKVLGAKALKNKTQKAALQVLRKEEDNATRSRMESLLIQQYTKKFGTKQTNSAVNAFIRMTVHEFLDSLVNMQQAQSQLDALETKLKVGVEELKSNQKKSNQQRMERIEQAQSCENSMKQLQIQRALSQQQEENGHMPHLNPEEDAKWPVINTIIALNAEEQQIKKEKEALRKKEKYQRELHDQVESIRQREERARREKEDAARKMQEELSAYERDKQMQKKKKEEKFAREKAMRAAQIEERNAQRQRERDMKIAQEQREMARARRAQQQEEENRIRLREREKEAQDRLLIENEHNKAIKQEELRKQYEYEAKLQREYEARMAKEEADRAAAFKARMDALQNFSKNYESRVGARLQEARKEEDDKVHAALIEAERKRAEKEDRDRAQKKAALIVSTEFNIQMMEEKRRQKDQERLDAIERRRKMEQDAQDQKRQEREANEKKRLQMLEMKQQLDSQMRQRVRNRNEEIALSSTELRFNKSIIDKVNNDPNLAKKVMDRLNPSVSTSRSETHRNIFA